MRANASPFGHKPLLFASEPHPLRGDGRTVPVTWYGTRSAGLPSGAPGVAGPAATTSSARVHRAGGWAAPSAWSIARHSLRSE